MQNKITSLCHQLLISGLPRARALCGLLLSLCGNVTATSVVQLSLSPLFQHQYASITDTIDELGKSTSRLATLRTVLLTIVVALYRAARQGSTTNRSHFLFTLDATPCAHPFAPTLERKAIVLPNPQFQAYHLSKGYCLSALNAAGFVDDWCLPLDLRRLQPGQTPAECGRQQISLVLEELARGRSAPTPELYVVVADAGYGNSPFVLPLARDEQDLVTITRLKVGSKVYLDHRRQSVGQIEQFRKDKIYGDELFLRMTTGVKSRKNRWHKDPSSKVERSISEVPADDCSECKQTRGRRTVTIKVERWNGLLLRWSHDDNTMADHPVDVVRIEQRDEQTGQLVFKNELYLLLAGKRRDELSAQQAYQDYSCRKDTESYFRTAKHRFLLTGYQSCVDRHHDVWWCIVMLAGWFTWLTREHGRPAFFPWERYGYRAKVNQPSRGPSFSQAIRAAAPYLCTLDWSSISPQKQKGGSGRALGTILTPRARHVVLRKASKEKEKSAKSA